MESCSNGVRVEAEDPPGCFGVEAQEIDEHDRGALLLGQAAERSLDVESIRDRAGRVRDDLGLANLALLPAGPPSVTVPVEVEGGAVEVRARLVQTRHTVPALEDPEHRLLSHVVSLLAVPGDQDQGAVEPSMLSLEERLEGRPTRRLRPVFGRSVDHPTMKHRSRALRDALPTGPSIVTATAPQGVLAETSWLTCASMARVVERGAMADVKAEPEAGDVPRSFERFFQDEYERLGRALYLVTGDPIEAEDVAQEAMVRLYERWDRVPTGDPGVGYLYRTALNLHRSRLRRAAVRLRRGPREDAKADPLSVTEDRDELGRLLAALPDGQREALVLVAWLGMTDEEAGVALSIEPVSVRVRVSRAKASLRAAGRDRSDEESDEP